MLTVRDVMDADPQTVTEETPIREVVELMRDNELSGLPVVNEGGRCVGIITENDMVMGEEEGDIHFPRFIELFGGVVFLESLKKFEEKFQRAAASKAGDLMTEDPQTIGPDATLQEAGRLISRTHHNRIPVVEHGRLIGLVTRVDVLDGLTRHDD
jgi:CBS domain-containing protein